MSSPRPDDDLDPDGPERPEGRIEVTGPTPLVGFAILGLVAGWSARPLAFRMGYLEPRVPLVTIALLFFAAAVVGGSAYATWRAVRRDRASLQHHQAVNRLVLGKACALAGALFAGGYLGYAVAQLGIDEPASDGRLWRSVLAALGGVALCAASLLLERACRVPSTDD